MRRSIFEKLSVSSIVAALLGQVLNAIRYELDVAKREFTEKLKALLSGAILVVFALGFLGGATGLFVLAGVHALTYVWPLWKAALVGGAALVLIAAILLAIGTYKIRKNKDLRPERAVSALRRFSAELD